MNEESIRALQSAIRKSEKALEGMIRKGASTTLLEGRLKALRIGLSVLEKSPFPYTRKETEEALAVLRGLIVLIGVVCERFAPGSSQRTLAKRRVKALESAVQGLEELLERVD